MKTLQYYLAVFFVFIWCIQSYGESNPSEIKSKLEFVEGNYVLVEGSEERCQADVVDLRYEYTEKDVILRLGQKFIFANITQDHFIEPGEHGCSFETNTEIKKKNIKQSTKHVCNSSDENYRMIMTLTAERENLKFTYEKKINQKTKNAKFECLFKMANQKRGSEL